MNNNSIEITPLSPAIGAEIRGVDLREPLSNRQFDEIHNAFAEHQVLFFRGQEELAPEAQVRSANELKPNMAASPENPSPTNDPARLASI